MPADGRVVDANVVIGQPADGVAFLGHVVFRQGLAVQAENQACHGSRPNCRLVIRHETYDPNRPRNLRMIPASAGNASATRTRTTETLSRPPLSFVSLMSCSPTVRTSLLNVLIVRWMSSSSTMSGRPSEHIKK